MTVDNEPEAGAISDGHVDPSSPFFGLIKQAYETFCAPTPDGDGACKCCMDEDIQKNFYQHGQEGMPLLYLKDWYHAAVYPDLDKEIWRYLLPRIMDALAANAEISWAGNDIALRRFPTGKRENWTAGEWAIIDQFQRLYLARETPNIPGQLDDDLCMFALGGWDIQDLFGQIFAWSDEKLVATLWRDWCKNGYASIEINFLWPDMNVPETYYTSDALHDRMLATGMDARVNSQLRDKAMAVADVIYSHRQQMAGRPA